MTQRIIFNYRDGGVGIFTPSVETLEAARGDLHRIARQHTEEPLRDREGRQILEDGEPVYRMPKGTTYQVIDASLVPTDKTFFAASTCDERGVHVDMAKARTLHMNRLRTLRDKRLAALDVAYMRALEEGDKATAKQTAQDKQWLRDMPAQYDLSVASTPEALRAMVPALLQEEV